MSYFSFSIKNISPLKTIHDTLENEVNSLIKTDFNTFIENKRHINSNKIYKNGAYSRFLETEVGLLSLKIPRCRKCKYFPSFLTPYKRQSSSLLLKITTIIKEVNYSFKKARNIIKTICGIDISDTHIRTIAEKYIDDVNTFFTRKLDNKYKYLLLDGTYFNKKDKKFCLHSVLALDERGKKELLSFKISKTENNITYKQLLEEVKERGITDVKLVVSDGFLGLEEKVKEVFPSTSFGMCFLHHKRAIERNDNMFITKEEKREYLKDITHLVKSDLNFNESIEKLRVLYKKHSHICTLLNITLHKMENLINFRLSPKNLWKSLYTTNLIETFNKHLKRYYKPKEHIDKVDNLIQFVSTFCLQHYVNTT